MTESKEIGPISFSNSGKRGNSFGHSALPRTGNGDNKIGDIQNWPSLSYNKSRFFLQINQCVPGALLHGRVAAVVPVAAAVPLVAVVGPHPGGHQEALAAGLEVAHGLAAVEDLDSK